nr:VOC family protein [Micropruina sp. KQZ13P-5]
MASAAVHRGAGGQGGQEPPAPRPGAHRPSPRRRGRAAAGARRHAGGRPARHHGPGTGWVVLADPEGNEFCVLRSDAERS